MIDYRRSIVNITNSLYKHYGLSCYHESLNDLDRVLSKKPRHVFLMVLDGLGEAIITKHLPETAFLRRHQTMTLSSVFPPTTVAATTSILTGKTPYEHGFLGWFQYFKALDSYYTVFLKKDYYTHAEVPKVLHSRFQFTDFTVRIKQAQPSLYTKTLFHKKVSADGFTTFEEGLEWCLKIAKLEQQTLTYFYHIEPDNTMHHVGPSDRASARLVQALNAQIEAFYAKLPKDSLVIITADHGMVDVEPLAILDQPIMATLKAKPSNEPRAVVFHVEDHKAFKDCFNKDYSDDFDLYTTQAFLDKGFLGAGKKHQNVTDCLGDYVAIAKTDKYFSLDKDAGFKGHHAGKRAEELEVPLILLMKE